LDDLESRWHPVRSAILVTAGLLVSWSRGAVSGCFRVAFTAVMCVMINSNSIVTGGVRYGLISHSQQTLHPFRCRNRECVFPKRAQGSTINFVISSTTFQHLTAFILDLVILYI